MELKNILARQPGAEIHQQLASYKESLKDKQSQMKKMMAELKNSQESVDLLKFENNRLRDELSNMKRDYFRRRRQEDQQKDIHQQQQQLNGMYPPNYQHHQPQDGMNMGGNNQQLGQGLVIK